MRIKMYLDVEQEAEAIVEGNRPAESWSAMDAAEIINYTTRYRPDGTGQVAGLSRLKAF